ncbi:MAG TPA: glycosyltransferase [Anaerolineaceae bacterium]|nr:glycosyltransferase [Anaerolineaceae bacterium]
MSEPLSPPLVSVVIPVFNGQNYLREAIESVFSQTYAPVELIVVDDGSQDATWEIIQSYGERLWGIRKENGGVASALNLGFEQAQGEWIAWLSHDDLFLPEKLEQQIHFVTRNPQVGVCYADFEIVDANGGHLSVVTAPWFPPAEMPRQFIRNMYINGSTTLIRRDCWRMAGGFNERLAHTQDFDMWLRMADYTEFGHLPKVVLKSRAHPLQGSWNFEYQLQEEQIIFCETFERLGPERFFPELAALQNSPQRAARAAAALGDLLWQSRGWHRFARDQYAKSSRICPSLTVKLKWGLAQWMLVLLGDELLSLTHVKRARLLLGQGGQSQARRLSGRMWLRHPVRLDALMIWLISFVPPAWFQQLKLFKRRLVALHG